MSRLDRYLEAVREDRRPRPFVPTDDEATTMTAAIALSAARPDGTSPRPEFVEELRARLDRPAPTRVPRRGVVIGGSVAAGAAVVGAAVDRLAVTADATNHGEAGSADPGTIEPNDGQWRAVAASDRVPDGGAVAFDTGTVSGFVFRQAGVLSARSCVCSHQGCHLRLNDAERRLDCPCHRTGFGFDGTVITSQLPKHPPRLPAIQVREQDGQIQVYA
jgi:nitrite reductase/ring-hydroxylating ferredoxin subunit